MVSVIAVMVLAGCGTVREMGPEESTSDGPDAGQHVARGSDGGPGEEAGGGEDAAPVVDKIVFVSSVLVTGGIGGVEQADGLCQALAEEVGLPGVFMAWLSDGDRAAADRLSHGAGNYLLVDGTPIAWGWDDLTDGALASAIARTETGDTAPATDIACESRLLVWTGSNPDGSSAEHNCAGWTSDGLAGAAVYGTTGEWSVEDEGWTARCSASCSQERPIYCIEQ